MSDDASYSAAVAVVFKRLVKAVDAADADAIDCDTTGDMVTISSPRTGEKVVVNTQRAVQQIWVAGKGQGVHFSLGADGRWVDDKGKGLELSAWVLDCVEAATGQHLTW